MTAPRERATELFRGADSVLDALTANSASGQHEVRASYVQEVKAVHEKDDFTVSASNATALFGIRTIEEGRQGFATTNADRPEALAAATREALEMARVSPPSEHRHVASDIARSDHAELCDPELLAIEPDDVYGYLGHLVDEARRDSRVTMERSEFTWEIQTDVLANSKGVRASSAHATCSWMAMGMARTDDEVSSFDYDGSTVWLRAGIEDAIAKTAVDFRESVIGSLGARKAKTYRGKVLLHPYVVLDLLGSAVTSNCNGANHVEGVSPWRGKLGEAVSSDLLTVYEDPHDRTLSSWSLFDREGRPTARHVLVDQGRLAFVAYDGYYAHRAGSEPTGNARGGAGRLPGTGFCNLHVTADGPSVMSEEGLVEALGTGLVVKRLSGNDDPFSGQFSGTAKNSWWVEDGRRTHAVNEVMIAGNLFDVLKQVVAAGDTLHELFASGRAPYLLVDGVSVTAG